MTQDEAQQLLGLSSTPSATQIEQALVEKKRTLEQRQESAPTPALKEKYQRQLDELESAASALRQLPSRAGLSHTKLADLPQAAPQFGAASAPMRASTISKGTLLAGRFEVREFIAEGGMGAVWRAFDRNRNKEIALKVLLPGMLDSAKAKERFLQEAQLSSELSHPGIVNVYDVQRENDTFFFTMELLEGQNLRTYLDALEKTRQRMTVEEALRIINELVEALAYAHKSTIHRDIKPENVWIDRTGKIKLMDFGIARALNVSNMTKMGVAMGTAYYMAPEQLRGLDSLDGRADQYSLAVLLYEMLSGQIPTGRIDSLHLVRKDVPKAVSLAVDKALSADPAKRFATITEFGKALHQRGVAISLPSGSGRLLPAVLVLIVVIALGAGASLVDWKGLKSSIGAGERELAQAKLDALQLEGKIDVLAQRIEQSQRVYEQKLREAQSQVKSLESSLRSARDNRQELEEALDVAKSELQFINSVNESLQVVVYESSQRISLAGQQKAAQALIQEKDYVEAKAMLSKVESGYVSLLELVGSAEKTQIIFSATSDRRTAWMEYALKHSHANEPKHLELEERYAAATALKDQGQWKEAMQTLQGLGEEYNALHSHWLQEDDPEYQRQKAAKLAWEQYRANKDKAKNTQE